MDFDGDEQPAAVSSSTASTPPRSLRVSDVLNYFPPRFSNAASHSRANVSALVLYLGCAVASWRLRQMGVQGSPSTGGAGFTVPLAGVVPWLATAVIVWLLTGLAADEWLGFGVCVAAASIVYAVTRANRS